MPQNMTKFTVRLPDTAVAEIDAMRIQHGFGTRSSFLRAAAAAYGGCVDDALMRALAQLSFELHRLGSDSGDRLVAADQKKMVRAVKKTMRDVREAVII